MDKTGIHVDKTGIHPGGEGVQAVAHGHDPHHDELGFWRKYVFSVDHKVIGIQYAITGLLFLLFGFTLMMIMRWQLAYPPADPADRMWLGRRAHRWASCCPSSTTSWRDARHHHGVHGRRASLASAASATS
jgi:hypothetical protein